jgi:transposase
LTPFEARRYANDGPADSDAGALFYEFDLERHVPSDHLLRSIDRFVDLEGLREHLRPYYSDMGRPSVDPELMIRMLLVGYCSGIRSERRLCEEVHLNLAYRWFCRPGPRMAERILVFMRISS